MTTGRNTTFGCCVVRRMNGSDGNNVHGWAWGKRAKRPLRSYTKDGLPEVEKVLHRRLGGSDLGDEDTGIGLEFLDHDAPSSRDVVRGLDDGLERVADSPQHGGWGEGSRCLRQSSEGKVEAKHYLAELLQREGSSFREAGGVKRAEGLS